MSNKCPLRIVITKSKEDYYWQIQGYNGKVILVCSNPNKNRNILMRTIKNFTDKMSSKRVEIVNQ